jgi:hypothetical protein
MGAVEAEEAKNKASETATRKAIIESNITGADQLLGDLAGFATMFAARKIMGAGILGAGGVGLAAHGI